MSLFYPMSSIIMHGFGKQFREGTYLKLPLGRDWDGITKALATHIAKQKSKWGGLVSEKTTLRQVDRIVSSYESAFLVYMHSVLKKDDSVKNSMLLALGVTVAGPATVSGGGFSSG